MVKINDLQIACEKIATDYVCPSQSLTIQKFGNSTKESSCANSIFQMQNGKHVKLRDMEYCDTTLSKNIDGQQYLMNQDILTISSPINDTLHYNCKVFANNQDEIIEVGTNFYRLNKECHYETSQLIINSAPIMQVLTMQDISNNENDIVRQISDLESLVEQTLPQINMTKLNLQLKKYDKTMSHAGHSVQDITRTLDTLEKLNKVAIFSPTSLDLQEPMAASNWITIMFWTIIVCAVGCTIYMIHKTCPGPCMQCMTLPFVIAKRILCKAAASVGESLMLAFFGPDHYVGDTQDVEMQESNAPCLQQTADEVITQETYTQYNCPPLIWTMQTAHFKALVLQAIIMESDCASTVIKYCPVRQVIVDHKGRLITFLPPPEKTQVNQYLQMLRNTSPNPTFMDSVGTLRHKEHTYLTYDMQTKLWTNTQNNQIVIGLSVPILDPPMSFDMYQNCSTA